MNKIFAINNDSLISIYFGQNGGFVGNDVPRGPKKTPDRCFGIICEMELGKMWQTMPKLAVVATYYFLLSANLPTI